ncbi:hypothetical protein, variant 1 [Saprolegnia diclina VS20]|uniref:Uncharacterized protein n=1 Tax=Saprolegnia diclina (strain VS20) TaxID=1156394 RepID=T0SF61_SAPDV|nr:hypothetical protein, variant 1 [Saprolegnia diclina VS20]EQC41532.1 hypothetical protein, variant 1 [Saprolegnia diclina VS20]|eukprot:XP_008605247.1 hypothetical protein, variant 1 [Saprolegnia diclina VS20]
MQSVLKSLTAVLLARAATAELTIVTPHDALPDGVPYTLLPVAQRPLYRGKIVGPLVTPAAPNATAIELIPAIGNCPAFAFPTANSSTDKPSEDAMHRIALLPLTDLPDCKVVDRVRQAQAAGAIGAFLYDANQLNATVPFESMRPAADITIPAVFLGGLDAARLEQLASETPVVALLRWTTPHPETHVSFDVYFPSTARMDRGYSGYPTLLATFGDLVRFTPHFEMYRAGAWGCGNMSDSSLCAALCVDGACTYDPEDDATVGLDGKDVLAHDVLAFCAYEHSKPNASAFWDVTNRILTECTAGVDPATCRTRVLASFTPTIGAAIAACADNNATEFYNAELQHAYAAGVATYPLVTINDQPLYEDWACDEPISMTTCAPLSVLCRYLEYSNVTLPDGVCAPEYWQSRCLPPHAIDDCGVCNERDSAKWSRACRGCDNVVHSNKTLDVCGVCGGDGSFDICGECLPAKDSRRDTVCADCKGEPWGPATRDACGVCGGHGSFDACGLCFQADDPRRQNYGCQLEVDPDAVHLKLFIRGVGAGVFGQSAAVTTLASTLAAAAKTEATSVHIRSIETVDDALVVNIFLLPTASSPEGASENVVARLGAIDVSALVQDVYLHSEDASSSRAVDVKVLSMEGGAKKARTVPKMWYVGALGGLVVSTALTTWLVQRRDRRLKSDMRQLFARYTPLVAMDEEDS